MTRRNTQCQLVTDLLWDGETCVMDFGITCCRKVANLLRTCRLWCGLVTALMLATQWGSRQLVTDLLWGIWCNGFWPLSEHNPHTITARLTYHHSKIRHTIYCKKCIQCIQNIHKIVITIIVYNGQHCGHCNGRLGSGLVLKVQE